MRFRKNVPAEIRDILREQLKQYKKEISSLTKEELQELEKWVSCGRSPYDNGDYIYTEYGYPMDFIQAMRLQEEQYNWLMSLSEEEREKELQNIRGEYDTTSDDIIIMQDNWHDPGMDSDAELPFQ